MSARTLDRLAFLTLPLLACAVAAAQTPAPIAGAGDVATLDFRVQDPDGKTIPGRLTFVPAGASSGKLFPTTDAAPDELAVRDNVVFSKSGHGLITVPPGTYTVYASRGMEWSIASQDITFVAGRTATFRATLRREVDTTGWVSGDYHLHTLTHSGHGDANVKERIITFVGEGLEFAVATDHNHNIDYAPTVRELGITGQVATVVGNEVSTPIGHFNAFPLDPARPVPPPSSNDANHLFKLIRAETNEFGIVPVIQLNHPRWGGIDYFGRTELDPITGTSAARSYSSDFDTLEVFNDNPGWGYYDAEASPGVATGATRHWVLGDWFNLLNRGHRYAAVGNSDSHTVKSSIAGVPRNYTASPTDDPAQISPKDVAAALRAGRSYTTFGPIVGFRIHGEEMGGQTQTRGGDVEIEIRVQAASWIDCDRVKIVVNGDVVETLPVPDTREPERLRTTHKLALDRDAWIVLLVEGDDSLAPIVADAERPIRPLAVTNPIRVDADGDGTWTAPYDQAVRTVARGADAVTAALAAARPHERGLLLLAAADSRAPGAADWIAKGLGDPDSATHRLAARAAETLGDASLRDALDEAFAATADPFQAALLVRACARLSADDALTLAKAYLDRFGSGSVGRYSDEVLADMPARRVRDWQVAGYYPGEKGAALGRPLGPESPSSPGQAIPWKPARANDRGFLDLRTLGASPADANDKIAFAQAWLETDADREVMYALGTDDGCRVWINDELVVDDPAQHGATPFQHVGVARLKAGRNRVLFKIYNVGGATGAYLRVFDRAVTVAEN